MTANDYKSYLSQLNKLADEYNNTYHRSIGKIPIHVNYPALSESSESSHKASTFKFGDRFNMTKYKNNFWKSYKRKIFD